MRSIPICLALLLVGVLAGCSGFARTDDRGPVGDPVRSFTIEYEAQLDDLTVGEELRLWIPVPHDDPHQRIGEISVDGPWKGRRTIDKTYGNAMLYFEGTVTEPSMTFTVSYDVDRFSYASDLGELSVDGAPDGAAYDRYRKPSALAYVTPQVEEEARRLTEGKSSTLEEARAFYDYVLGHMSYDKNHVGWGRGSIEHACAVGKGNCTDFHSYFTSLCLAAGITSRFQIGIYGNYESVDEEYTTGGYHCWAEFRVPGKAWVPVDISEADQDDARVDEFFGSHTANRVTLSTGRDLRLAPPQEGAPLNYFLYPYAEQDGKPLESGQVTKTSRWRDRPVS